MKWMKEGRTWVLTELLALGFAVAPTASAFSAEMNLRSDSDTRSPQISASPSVLDFGLVGVGRTKDLTFTVSNPGGAILKGTASATGPFSVAGGTYALKPGESKALKIRYKPLAPGTNTGSIFLSGGSATQVALSGSARALPQPPQNFRFVTPEEVNRADFIVRYSDDRTSYVVKPVRRETVQENAFYSPLTSAEVVKLAAERPQRELAIIVLSRFYYQSTGGRTGSRSEDASRPNWQKKLEDMVSQFRKAGYQRFIFCEARGPVDKIAGLRVVEGPRGVTAL